MLKKSNQKGFTIIEVLIVLAIAAVIMLVVFLAVPALQRNSRNTQRTNDAALISAAINECLSNNNGSVSNCSDPNAAKLNTYIDANKLRQLTASGATPDVNTYTLKFNTKCDATGSASATGGGTRAYTVAYGIETSSSTSTRCVEG